MVNNKFGFHRVLADAELYELLQLLAESRTRLRAIKRYTNELQESSNGNNKIEVANKVGSYAPVMKLLDNDVDNVLDVTIYYFINRNY